MIKDILTDPSLKDVSTLLAVGGCAESPFIRETLQSSFPNENVLLPIDPSLAVLKGASMDLNQKSFDLVLIIYIWNSQAFFLAT